MRETYRPWSASITASPSRCRYFERHRLALDWPAFLDDFQRHWPTDKKHTYVDFVRDGIEGNGAARQGSKNWRRLCEERAGRPGSVFHFHAPGSMAKATHAGLPWLRFIRRKLGDHVRFWPFDGWDVPAGRSTIAEVYPAQWNQDFANDELTRDQQDAFSIAAFLSRADADGSLIGLLAPDLTDEERKLAEIEGWILGAAGPAAESRIAPKAARSRTAAHRAASNGPIVPGYTNSNGQTVLRRVYVLGCQWCGLQYEANVADIRLMRCPSCRSRAPGLAH